jgi:hypothetical protein
VSGVHDFTILNNLCVWSLGCVEVAVAIRDLMCNDTVSQQGKRKSLFTEGVVLHVGISDHTQKGAGGFMLESLIVY